MILHILIKDDWYSLSQEDIILVKKGKRHYYEYRGKRIKKDYKTKFNCIICGKEVIRTFFHTKTFDLRCEQCKIKQTKKQKYGNENYFCFGSKEFKNLMKEKYNVENISQTDKQKENLRNNKNIPLYGSDAYRENMIKKHRVEYPIQSKQIKSKIEKTNIKKFGSKNPSNSEKVMEKKKNNHLNKIDEKLNTNNIIRLFTNDEYQGSKVLHMFKCTICDYEFEAYLRNGVIPKCWNCNKKSITSIPEKELTKWLRKHQVVFEKNTRKIIPPYEIDIFIPQKNLAIEFNGLYWHSDLYKSRYYHKEKTGLIEDKGMQLIHIFEDEWVYKPDIVKNRLKNILGLNSRRIGARKTVIQEIEPKLKNEFLEKYHIQGLDRSTIKLGAFYDKQLIGVMTFSKPRLFMNQKKRDGNIWELSRFATISDTSTPGLGSKMLEYFKRNYEWDEIYSYADRRWSQGNLYKQLGFEFDSYTNPNYFYWKNNLVRYHRYNFRKQNLKKFENYSPEKTEHQIMDEAGWFRIWDSGNIKFVLKNVN